VVKANHGLHLRALIAVDADEKGTPRNPGDEWQVLGPTTYIPQPEVVRIIILKRLM